MGQCQSRSTPAEELLIRSKNNQKGQNRSKKNQEGRGDSRPKLSISLLSPSNRSRATQPETPSPLSMASHSGESPKTPQFQPLEEDEDEEKHQGVEFSIFSFSETPSLVGGVVGFAIEEEESLGAPSDEEYFHEQTQKQEKEPEEEAFIQQVATVDDVEASPTSTKRRKDTPRAGKQQSRVKLLRTHVTSPKSIIHRPSLVAPPKGVSGELHSKTRTSVNPHTIADFNKLKVQVQLARRAEKHRRRKAKLEDRIQDVQGYRNLWNAYEEIGEKVSAFYHDTGRNTATTTYGESQTTSTSAGRQRSNSLDLKQPSTWYFDFQGLHDKVVVNDDDDDDYGSQSNLSLLSEASMEAQRRLFAEKRKARRRKRARKKDDKRSDRSVSSRNSAASSCRSDFAACLDYGPGNSLTDMEVLVNENDSTPRASSRRSRAGGVESDDASQGTDDGSCCSYTDGGNDYKVPRRRRHVWHQPDDSSLSTYDDRSYDTLRGASVGLEINYLNQFYGPDANPAPTAIHVKKKRDPLPTAKDQYGFDPSAPLCLEMETHNLPSVEIADAATGQVRWRQFPDSSTRRLETQYTEEATEAAQKAYLTEEDPVEPTSESMLQGISCCGDPMAKSKNMDISEGVSTQETEQQGAAQKIDQPECYPSSSGPGPAAISTTDENSDPIGSASKSTEEPEITKGGHETTSQMFQSSPRTEAKDNESETVVVSRTPLPVVESKLRTSEASETYRTLQKSYDPTIGQLSTDQFLLISSPATNYSDLESMDDQVEGKSVENLPKERHPERRQWMERKRGGKSQRVSQPHVLKNSSPGIAHMTTEEFLLISARHSIAPRALGSAIIRSEEAGEFNETNSANSSSSLNLVPRSEVTRKDPSRSGTVEGGLDVSSQPGYSQSPVMAKMSMEESLLVSARHSIVQAALDNDVVSEEVEDVNETYSMKSTCSLDLVQRNEVTVGKLLVHYPSQNETVEGGLDVSCPSVHCQGGSLERTLEPSSHRALNSAVLSEEVEEFSESVSVKYASSLDLVQRNKVNGGKLLLDDPVSSPPVHSLSQGGLLERTSEPLPPDLERNDDLAAQVTQKVDLLLAKFRSIGVDRAAGNTAGCGDDSNSNNAEGFVQADRN